MADSTHSAISKPYLTTSNHSPTMSTLTLPLPAPLVWTVKVAGRSTGTRLNPSPLKVTRDESTISSV